MHSARVFCIGLCAPGRVANLTCVADKTSRLCHRGGPVRTDLQPSRGGGDNNCGSMFPELEKSMAEFRQKDGLSSVGVPSVRDAGSLGGLNLER